MSDSGGLGPYPRFVAWLCRVVLRLLARVRVEGLERVPAAGPLIVAVNHASAADPPLVGGWLTPALGRRPHFLAKEALFHGPMGTFLRSQGAIPVRAGGSDTEAYRAARALLEQGRVLVIFPEGTRSHDGVMGQPLPGVALLALRTGVPVLPVGVSGTDRFLGRDSRLPRLGVPVTLRVGTPIELASEAEGSRREALTRANGRVMRAIAALTDERHRGDWA